MTQTVSLMEQINRKLEAYHAELVKNYHQVLSETLFASRTALRPSVLGRIASAEAEALFNFLLHPLPDVAMGHGKELGRAGLSTEAVLRMGQITWHFCLAHLEEDLRLLALETAEAYHNAVVRGFIQMSQDIILEEQERIRSALQRIVDRRALQLEILFTVAQHINFILDPDVLINRVVDLIEERYGYYYVGIFLVDKSGKYIAARAGSGEAGRQLVRQEFRLKVGEPGLVGWVAQHQQYVRANDVSKDDRYASIELVSATQAEMALPLGAGENFIGVLDLRSDHLNDFSDEDVRVFQSLVSQVAIALQNATAYEIQSSRLMLTQTLYDVTRSLTQTLDPGDVLKHVLEDLAQIMSFDRGSVMLRSENVLEITAAYGFPPESDPLHIRVPIVSTEDHTDIYDEIYKTKRPLLIPEVLERPDWYQVETLPQARSWLGVPLVREGEIIGVLSLTRESPTPFAPDDVSVAETFAGHTAIALYNAQMYDRLSHAYDQLERLDQAKTDFITVVSHELRTPLTIMRGFSQMLSNDPQIKSNPMHLEMVEGIYSGTVRLYEIVNTMLDMAKIDNQTLQLSIAPLTLPDLLQGVVAKFADALKERNLAVVMEEMNALPDIEADEDSLPKVFYHVIMNAIKYTPDGGQITLSAHLLQPTQADQPEAVDVTVRDTGIGIDPSFHELIFAKFYHTGDSALHSSGTTKFKGGGPGLGLAIAKGIVEAHGGRIWVESAGYDEAHCPGSTFHIVLPLRQVRKEELPEVVSAAEQA